MESRQDASSRKASAALNSLSSERKNLVIVRAGASSLHPKWTAGAGEREFDLLVAAYEQAAPRGEGDLDVVLPGSKIAGYHEVFRTYPEILDRYDFIALFDDDIDTTKQDINRLFSIGREHHLDLFQPALSSDSFFSYAATLASGNRYRLRFTNTVEMMCPVFSSGYLAKAGWLFGLSFETGIDLIWTRLTDNPWFRFAIVDEVVVRHTRPVGTTKTRQGFDADETYDTQVEIVLKRFNATFRGFVTYAAVDQRDRLVRSRFRIGLNSLSLWAAIRKTPLAKRVFARRIADYTRHCWLRPVNLQRIHYPQGDHATMMSDFNPSSAAASAISPR